MSNENIFKALAEAGIDLRAARFDSVNPHFKNKYASLGAIIDAIRPVFALHGLAIVQPIDAESGHVITRILHISGESMEGTTPIMMGANATAQQYGSALTYARRYGLSSLACISADDDDDGEVASHPAPVAKPPVPPASDDRGYDDDAKKARPASDKQKARMRAIAGKAGYKDADLKTASLALFGVVSSADLTWGQVDTLVELCEAGKLTGGNVPFGEDQRQPRETGSEG